MFVAEIADHFLFYCNECLLCPVCQTQQPNATAQHNIGVNRDHHKNIASWMDHVKCVPHIIRSMTANAALKMV